MPYSIVNAGFNIEGAYHIYGMLWTATQMSFYIDNTMVYQTPTPAFMNEPQFMIIDLGMGGGGDDGKGARNPVTGLPDRTDMYVDYVRAYSPN